MVFLLDTSSSVGDVNFNKVLVFITGLLEQAQIDSGDVRVGVMSYSTDVEIHFYLNQYNTKATIFQAIRLVK